MKDPKGYYRILEIEVTASAADIKAAFRRRAMELHPDRNASPGATAAFQRLNEAYALLSDPSSRAQYDTAEIETPSRESPAQRERPEPIACSVCGKVTAQPRYVIFMEVKSWVFMTTRTPLQGIFCSSCAEKKALRATTVTWMLGWWGIPWGPIYSVAAILRNLIGGEVPAIVNARLSLHQAWAFAVAGQHDLAAGIARDALDLASKFKPDHKTARIRRALGYEHQEEGTKLWEEITSLLEALKAPVAGTRLKDSWPFFCRSFFVQAAACLVVAGLLAGLIASEDGSSPSATQPYVAHAPASPLRAPAYVRPDAAPNGEPWPTAAAYVANYPTLNANGLSTVTVDNSQNNSDVFVKLVALNGTPAYPVRTFYIPAFGKFTVNKVTQGNYDVRYRDLSNGGLSRSEPFTVEETAMADGTEYTEMTMTLYKVKNGNMQTYPISETEF